MRWFRLTVLLLILTVFMISLAAPTGAFAQQTQNCFKLNAADCKIYTAAIENISKLTTFQPVVELTVDYRYNDRSLKYIAKGTGAVDLTGDVFAAIEENDQKKLANAIKFSLNMDGTLTTTEKSKKTTTKMGIKYLWLDGYLNTQTIVDGKASGWDGTDLLTMIGNQEYLQNATAGGLDDKTAEAFKELLADAEFITAMQQLPRTPNFLTLSRTGTNATIDKQKMIEFAYVYDFSILFRTHEMNLVMKKFLDFIAVQSRTRKLTDTQVNIFVGLMANALKGTTFKSKPWIGAQDNMFHALTLEGTFNFRGSAIYSTDNVNAKMTLKIIFDKIGEAVEITTPE